MKKLKLKALELGASEVLTRAQLRNVLGGDGSGGSGPCLSIQHSCNLYIVGYGDATGVCGNNYQGTGCACYATVNGVVYQTNNGGTECNV